MKRQILHFTLPIILFMTSCFLAESQVTIGSSTPPQKGALLDLKQYDSDEPGGPTSTMGLMLPIVELSVIDKLYPMFKGAYGSEQDALHAGLVVYNLTINHPFYKGLFAWDGTRWVGLSDGKSCMQPTEMSLPNLRLYQGTTANFSVYMKGGDYPQELVTYEWTIKGPSGFTTLTGRNSTIAIAGSVSNVRGDYKVTCVVTICGIVHNLTGTLEYIQPLSDLIVAKQAEMYGHSYFDVAQTDTHGNLTVRNKRKADFSIDPGYVYQDSYKDKGAMPASGAFTRRQTYSFVAGEAGYSLYPSFVDVSGRMIDSVRINHTASGNIGFQFEKGQVFKVEVLFKENLNEYAKGTNELNPLMAQVFLTYQDNSFKPTKTMAEAIDIVVMDAPICGAQVVTIANKPETTRWMHFACRDLGVPQTVDPFTPSKDLLAPYYPWGYGTPALGAYEVGAPPQVLPNSEYTFPIATLEKSPGVGAWNAAELQADEPRVTKNTGVGMTNVVGLVMKDPCPKGWRTPTSKELALLLASSNVPVADRFKRVTTAGGTTPYNTFYSFGEFLNFSASPTVGANAQYVNGVNPTAGVYQASYFTSTRKLVNVNGDKSQSSGHGVMLMNIPTSNANATVTMPALLDVNEMKAGSVRCVSDSYVNKNFPQED